MKKIKKLSDKAISLSAKEAQLKIKEAEEALARKKAEEAKLPLKKQK